MPRAWKECSIEFAGRGLAFGTAPDAAAVSARPAT